MVARMFVLAELLGNNAHGRMLVWVWEGKAGRVVVALAKS